MLAGLSSRDSLSPGLEGALPAVRKPEGPAAPDLFSWIAVGVKEVRKDGGPDGARVPEAAGN